MAADRTDPALVCSLSQPGLQLVGEVRRRGEPSPGKKRRLQIAVASFDHAFEFRVSRWCQLNSCGQCAGERSREHTHFPSASDRRLTFPDKGFRDPPDLIDQRPHSGCQIAALP